MVENCPGDAYKFRYISF